MRQTIVQPIHTHRQSAVPLTVGRWQSNQQTNCAGRTTQTWQNKQNCRGIPQHATHANKTKQPPPLAAITPPDMAYYRSTLAIKNAHPRQPATTIEQCVHSPKHPHPQQPATTIKQCVHSPKHSHPQQPDTTIENDITTCGHRCGILVR